MPFLHKDTVQAGLHITRTDDYWGTAIGQPATVSFGFHTSPASFSIYANATFSALSAAEQAAARSALQLWASVANISFADFGNSNSAVMEFANYQVFDGAAAFAFLPQTGNTSAANWEGDVFINTYYTSTTNLNPGTYAFLTMVHEIGHALGLSHPGNYNAAPGAKITYEVNAEYVEDTHQYSVMSYFGETFTGANYFGINPETPMLDDIAAIQRLYGANLSTRTGATTYGFNSNAGAPFSITSSDVKVVFTVWDAGGTDTLDFSGYTQAQAITLVAESFSSVGGLISNVAIARGVTIENAIGGSGSDTIVGNGADNRLTGGQENDSLDGGAGIDIAVFSGPRSAYTLTPLSGNSVRVSGPDGTDTLVNVETLRFSDLDLAWPPVATGDDYADGISDVSSPFGLVVVNGSGSGLLETTGDRDWFRVQLTAGATYTIELQGSQAGGGLTLTDPYLRLHDAAGALLSQNDDISAGVNRDSRLTYTAASTGTYYVNAGAAGDGYQGTYRVSVVPGATSSDDFADRLSDVTAPVGQVSVNGSTAGGLEVAGDRDWFSVQFIAGVTYEIDLRGLHAGAGTLEDPYVRLYGLSGVLLLENDDIVLGVNRDAQLSYTATTAGTHYIEAGAFDDGYAGTYVVGVSRLTPLDDFADFLGDGTAPLGQLPVNATRTGSIEALGDRDWFQVQLAANTTYVFNLQGEESSGGTLEDPMLRVRDGSGGLLAENDDIVLGQSRDAQLTFTSTAAGTYYVEASAFDDDYSGTYTVGLALSLASSIIGDELDNSITGTSADDSIQGLGGADLLDGGPGNDALFGGKGSDRLVGGPGNDSIDGGVIADRINSSDGNWVFYGSSTGAINVNLATGIAQDGMGGTDILANINIVSGSNFNDAITGTSGREFEVFTGGAGNDYIDGGVISDTLLFKDANRSLYDTAPGAVTVDLRAGTATGGAGNDTLVNINQTFGSQYDDTLLGSDSALIIETFEGWYGSDILNGRGGFDIVRYNSAGTGISVNLATGVATDGLGYVDTLIGIEAIRGSLYDDFLTGGNPANGTGVTDGLETFQGNSGNDVINGGGGYDRVDYNFTGAGAVIVTLGGTGNGTAQDGFGTTDTLISIEGVRGSSSNDTLTGSDSGAFESFEGGEGNDALDGRGGVDRADYYYEPAGVTVNLASGSATDGYGDTDALRNIENVRGSRDYNDNLTGDSTNNLLEGEGGNDVLDGGAGADSLVGGAGNDTYKVDNAGDSTVENAGAGTDTVETAVQVSGNYVLAPNLENLTLTGGANLNGAGNTQNNVITGNSGNNVLDGGEGNDTLVGNGGDDSFLGREGADSYDGGTGVDTVYFINPGAGSAVRIADMLATLDQTRDAAGDTFVGVERLWSLDANVNDSFRGTAADDVIVTGGGDDDLVGRQGADVLDGGDGFDTVWYESIGGTGLVVDWLLPNASTGEAHNDILVAIERVFGAGFNDEFRGGNGNEVLAGGGGDDILDGRLGDDILDGGPGNDIFIGGLGRDVYIGQGGNDRYIITSAAESTVANPDIVVGFETGIDKLDLTLARTGVSDTYGFVATSEGKYLYVDLGGNGTWDMAVDVRGAIVAADLLW